MDATTRNELIASIRLLMSHLTEEERADIIGNALGMTALTAKQVDDLQGTIKMAKHRLLEVTNNIMTIDRAAQNARMELDSITFK